MSWTVGTIAGKSNPLPDADKIVAKDPRWG